MSSEFELIRRHFTRPPRHTDLAVGDDAALLTARPGRQMVLSTDMLISGTHFFPDTDPLNLGWKTLAVNVSDIAAMGAEPRWALLGLSLPAADEAWIAAFARGLFECADALDVDLIGGDTTRGTLALSVTIVGEVPTGAAITRAGACDGDDIWISGRPGRAALGLAHLRGQAALKPEDIEACLAALHRPQPRVALGLALRDVASAMLDVSDGLLGDLRHILERSGVGAVIETAALPLAPLRATGADDALIRRCLLSGGDDYELLFTAPPARRDTIAALAARLGLPLTRIGRITAASGQLLLEESDGLQHAPAQGGYDHFA